MSNLLISFAQWLCAGNEGLQMLKCAIWHAADPLMPCVLNEQLHIGIHAGNLYVDIDGNVHASMKARNYSSCHYFYKLFVLLQEPLSHMF